MFWTAANAVVSRLLSLTSGIVLARIFGTSDYGAYSLIQGTVGMFGTISGLGVSATATKYIAEYRESRKEDTRRVIALASSVALVSGAVFALLVLLLADVLASRALGSPTLGQPLRISAMLLLFNNLWGAQIGVLAGFEAFRSIAIVSIGGGCLSAAGAMSGGFLLGLHGALWGLVVGQAIICIFSHFSVVRVTNQHGVDLRLWGGGYLRRLLWSYSVPTTLAGLLVTPVNWACSAILANTPGGFAQLGLFNAANQWFGLVTFVPGLLGQTLIPILSERIAHDDASVSRRVVWASGLLNAVVASVIIVAVWCFGDGIARLYGKGFEATASILGVVLVTGGLVAVQSPVGHVLVASGRMWVGCVMNLGWGVCFICTARLLVHRGAVGLAEARLLAYLVHGVWTAWFAMRILRGSDERGTDRLVSEVSKSPGPAV